MSSWRSVPYSGRRTQLKSTRDQNFQNTNGFGHHRGYAHPEEVAAVLPRLWLLEAPQDLRTPIDAIDS